MKFIQIIIAFFAIGSCTPAPAQNVTVMSGFASWHEHRCAQNQACLNQNNIGIGVRFDGGEYKDYAAGIYKNSYYRTSVYVAKEFTAHIAGPLHVGLLAGVVTGYKYPVTPWLIPELIAKFDRYELALLAQPFGVDRAAALQLRMSFK
jgi:hypothetical protein